MNRSRQPKRRQRLNVTPPSRGLPFALRRLPLASAVSAVLAGGAPLAYAATAPDTAPGDTLEEVTVTAQKVTENLQNVPISIETFSTQKL
jgi:outer membrane receptor protein involved in Fe transport